MAREGQRQGQGRDETAYVESENGGIHDSF